MIKLQLSVCGRYLLNAITWVEVAVLPSRWLLIKRDFKIADMAMSANGLLKHA